MRAVWPFRSLSAARGCARINSRPDAAKIGSAGHFEVRRARLLQLLGSIQLQPSTQSWRVICVRDGSARKSASENLAGRSTRPPRSSDQSAKPFSGLLLVIVIIGVNGSIGPELRR